MTRERVWIWTMLVALATLVIAQPARAESQPPNASAIGPGWAYRKPIMITNAGDELRFFSVKISLDASNFDFDLAQSRGQDLRFTASDGWTLLSHWTESFDPENKRAVVWVNVPQLPSGAQKIFAYFGNPSAPDYANGARTFDFFDNFGASVGANSAGYFELGEATTILKKDQAWERTPPHTLSVVALKRDGYRFWGYYGLVDCGGIGLARSNDLATWTKSNDNPLLTRGGERWPSVLKVGEKLFMSHTRDYCGTSHIALRQSDDGVNWGDDDDFVVLVKPEPGLKNQNSHLFFDPVGQQFHLYWFRGGASEQLWQLKHRSAPTVAGLADPSSETTLIEEMYEIAAPTMLHRDGVYFLATEVNDRGWMTRVYSGTSPAGPFAPLPGNPILGDNQACFFQHEFDGKLFATLCKDTGPGGWVVNAREADLGAGRALTRTLDPSLWDMRGAAQVVPRDDDPTDAQVALPAGGQLLGSWNMRDFALDARVRLDPATSAPANADKTFALGVRADGDRNTAYIAQVSARADDAVGLELMKNESGRSRTLADSRTVAMGGASDWHGVSVRALSDTLTLVWDGETQIEARDDGAPIASGRISLSGGDGLTARLDDVRMRKVAAVEPIVAVAPAGELQRREGELGAWLGVRRSPTQPLSVHAPTPAAITQTLLTVIAMCFGVAIAVVALGRKR